VGLNLSLQSFLASLFHGTQNGILQTCAKTLVYRRVPTPARSEPEAAPGKWVTMLRDISRCRSCCDEWRRTRASELYHRYKRPVSSYHTLDGRPRGLLCSPNDLYARFGLVVWVWHSLGRTFVVHKRPLCSFVVCLAQYPAYPQSRCYTTLTASAGPWLV
jgi:hypothetical protein